MIADRAGSASRAYGVAPVDDQSPPTPSDKRYGVPYTALQIRAQIDTERGCGIAEIASRSGSRACGASERDEVRADLQLVTLVDPLTAPSWLDLEGVQAPLVRCTVLEDVVRTAAQAERRLANQYTRRGTGVRTDDIDRCRGRRQREAGLPLGPANQYKPKEAERGGDASDEKQCETPTLQVHQSDRKTTSHNTRPATSRTTARTSSATLNENDRRPNLLSRFS